MLTHWGRVAHNSVNKLNIIGSDNGLSPGRRQTIIWTDAVILLIWPLGINFSEMSIEIHAFLFKKMHVKISSAKWRPFCLGLNVLSSTANDWYHMESNRNDTSIIILFLFFTQTMQPGGRLNIKMPSYQYWDCHVKDKTVSPTVLSLTWKSSYLGKTVFILRRGPGSNGP